MTSLKAILSNISHNWWDITKRIAIVFVIIGAYWYGRVEGRMEANVEIKFKNGRIEYLSAKLSEYENRKTSHQAPSEIPSKAK